MKFKGNETIYSSNYRGYTVISGIYATSSKCKYGPSVSAFKIHNAPNLDFFVYLYNTSSSLKSRTSKWTIVEGKTRTDNYVLSFLALLIEMRIFEKVNLYLSMHRGVDRNVSTFIYGVIDCS